jgi:hypothetical protein
MRERRCRLFPAIVKDSFANGFPPRRRTGWREEGQGGVRERQEASGRVSWAGVGAGSERNNEFFRGVAGGLVGRMAGGAGVGFAYHDKPVYKFG